MKTMISGLLILFLANSAYAKNIEEIEKRQSMFKQIDKTADLVEEELDQNKVNWPRVLNESKLLVKHSSSLNSLFTTGNNSKGRAKSAIWEDPEKFNTLLSQLNTGFDTLLHASEKKDRKQALAGLETAQDTCRSCHTSYRSLW
ncbi:MAG: cytochrome c [Psychrobium sp.]